MKTKYFFSRLLGDALLAACNANDDLSLSNGGQEINPSAPVFNVTFDDNNISLTQNPH